MMTDYRGERILIDTNILFYATDEQSPFHYPAARQVADLVLGNNLFITGQIVREYANAVLRAARIQKVDWQRTLQRVDENLTRFQSHFELLYDDASTVRIWQSLLPGLTSGKPVHDLNIVATMRRHGIRHLFTHNVGDFAAFPDLVLIPLERS